jgi:hypothetical protein
VNLNEINEALAEYFLPSFAHMFRTMLFFIILLLSAWALWQMKKEVVRYSLHWPSNGKKIIDLPSSEARIPGLYAVERPAPFLNIFLL